MIASFVIVQQLLTADVGALLAAGLPAWVWATLLMAGFAALTVFTMLLVRIPTLRPPPRFDADEEDGDAEQIEDSDAATAADDAQRSFDGRDGGGS